MAVTGVMPLAYCNIVIGATFGTAPAALKRMPITGGTLIQHRETFRPQEQRGSFVRDYNVPVITKEWCEVTGLSIRASIEDLITLFRAGLAGISKTGGGPTNTSVYTYTFTPTHTSDNLKFLALEVGDDTQNFTLPSMLVNRWSYGWKLGGDVTATFDLIGQRVTKASATGSLSQRQLEGIPPTAKAYIDTTTIGSTLVTTVQEFQISGDNHFALKWLPDGNTYPGDYYRTEQKEISIEATLDFRNTTEFDAWTANTLRKVRTTQDGTAIASSSPSTNRQVLVDSYLYWDEAPFDAQDGQRVLKAKGGTVYNASAATDVSIVFKSELAQDSGEA